MKNLLLLPAWLFTIQCMAQDSWTQKADFAGSGRAASTGFSIGTKGYLAAGFDGSYKNDFWEYDPATNAWTQKANFGGSARAGASGFGIGTKGYLGTGADDSQEYKDFWEYDPALNTWTQKADFAGSARDGATGFSIGAKGYIGTGYDGDVGTKDFWEYDPLTNAWAQKADFGGSAREASTGFGTGTKGYIGLGYDENSNRKDFWEYDPSTNTWVQKTDFGGTERYGATGFAIGTKGYIGTGYDDIDEYKDFWEYDPSSDTWTQRANYGGPASVATMGFSIGTNGYLGTGGTSSLQIFKAFWEYAPLTVLPVTLTNVKAYQKKQGVQVEWVVQEENNIDSYEVEKSQKGQQFSTLEIVRSSGNSSINIKYDFFDPNPFSGITFYRIKIIGKSGSVTYSQVLKVNISGGSTLISIYPNPVIGNTIVLQLNNLEKGNYTISLTNKLGQQIIKKVIDHAGGSASETIEPSKTLAAGVYQLAVTGSGINIVRQIIKK